MSAWEQFKKWMKLTPEAAQTLRSRAIGAILAAGLSVLAVPATATAISSWFDHRLEHANIPLWLKAAIPAGAVIVSAVKSWLGAHVGDPTSVRFINKPVKNPTPPLAGSPADEVAPVADEVIEVGGLDEPPAPPVIPPPGV